MSSKVLAGRYELLEKIGEGGMSVVYKAKCRLLNRFVAIKILKPEFVDDHKFIESFRRESQAAASLSHPNIVNIYDVGKEGNIHYIVMELIEGKTLSEVIKEDGALPYEETIEITQQIAAALSFAHKNYIIHRDVKPHNILITNTGVAKITDFGIAKAMNSATIVENTGGVMGSVHYFSPEQARGGYVDEKSDIYSLGIVMYEMLTGRVPYDGENPVNIALMHINGEMVAPSKLISGIPPGLEQVVLKATDKLPANRYASADELIDQLKNLQFVGNVVGRSTFTNGSDDREDPNKAMLNSNYDEEDDDDYRQKKPVSKKKKIIIIAIIAAVLLIGVGVAAALGAFSGEDVTVPDLKGYTLVEAQQVAEKVDFTVVEGEKVFDIKAKEGEIVSQTPEANSVAKRKTTITVNISKGPGQAEVPKVTGMKKSEAKLALEKEGFILGDIESAPSDKEKGVIIEQDPGSGQTINKGTKVNVVVSDASKQKIDMPYLIGKNFDSAKSLIIDAGLTVGEITYGDSDTYKENQVMWQQYDSGEKLDRKTTIDIKVSQGEKEPTAVNFYIDFAKARNEVFYMTVTLSDELGTRNIISNQQRTKSDGGEEMELDGQGKGTVVVIFDGKQAIKKSIDFENDND
ncbi:MAG: Stk1 family PASTA domain-containing Ser/Thr kinase [Anaerovoracaceae bacterium]